MREEIDRADFDSIPRVQRIWARVMILHDLVFAVADYSNAPQSEGASYMDMVKRRSRVRVEGWVKDRKNSEKGIVEFGHDIDA
ncbi:MAG: hypothetical protein WCT01_03250 [Candidatus Shapirobacteria bacterium]